MGRSTSSSKERLNRGAWTAQEDKILRDYIAVHGEGKWNKLPQRAGLKRCGKSCRLRWLNYLRPNIKRGNISQEEEDLIIRLHKLLGNRWSLIAGRLPGRTDNEIKNYWNTNLAKRVIRDGHNNTSIATVSTTDQEKTNVFHAKASKCSKRLFIDHPLPHYSSMQLQREFTNEMEMDGNNELLSFPCSEFGGGKELSSTDHLLFDYCDEGIGEVCLSDLLNLDFSDTCDFGYNNNNINNNSSDEDLFALWDRPIQSNLRDETNVANNVHSSTSLAPLSSLIDDNDLSFL